MYGRVKMTRYSITCATPEQVNAVGAQNVKVLKRTGVIFAEMENHQVEVLKSQGCTVERIQKVGANVTMPQPRVGAELYTPQQLSQMAGFDDLRGITYPPLYGTGMNVAVIDTGVRETHEQVNGRVVFKKNYTTDVDEDGFDHGTGVASIIVAVAPQCNILDMKVMDSDGDSSTEEVIEAVEDCIELWDTHPEIAPVIINLSIGAEDPGNPNDPLRVACKAALENRIWVSAAAGNFGPAPMTIVTPACERYVMATGSIDPLDSTLSDFSSRGPTCEGLVKPDAVFFGENLKVASSQSDDAIVGKSGTSFSAPFSTGVSLLMIEGVARTGGARVIAPTVEGAAADVEAQISAEQLIDVCLGAMCVKPSGAPVSKDDEYGYGILTGSLVAQAISGTISVSQAIDLTTLVPLIMMVGVIGVMTEAVKEG